MMRVLVLGAYGLIGSEVVRRLCADGVEVIGFGRNAVKGRRLAPEIVWRAGDLNTMRDAHDWAPHLLGVDAVVNASGALQDGAKDKLAMSQDVAIRACIAACAEKGVSRFVQISAPGATRDAKTAFMRTKARADEALRQSQLTWTILKPGLVISAYAYGGTALMRMLAAFPLVQPLVLAGARMQTVAASDVAEAVSVALTTDRVARRDVDLVERDAHALAEIIAALRAWLGFSPACATVETPRFVGAVAAWFADIAGWLGWRSPLRTTTLSVLANNVLGDPEAGARALGRPLKSLQESLRDVPATLQERTFARAQLVFPLLVALLALFWIASGLIALAHLDAAARLLDRAVSPGGARALVIAGALADIAIGVGVCIRKTARASALAAAALSVVYLAMGAWLTPQIWADPLGPFVKVIPGIALALAVAALAEER
jgi:uncharacterized protein YbjT (DUF2867 family)